MYQWVKEYNTKGLEGLKAKKQEGRGSGKGNLKVADEVYVALKEEIAKTPNEKWTLKRMKNYLKEKHDMSVTEQAISYRMKRI